MRQLHIGNFLAGAPFSIPLEGVTKAYAINGIRESGKSSLGTVMAEEYCKLNQPWAAFDPGGNWWGLRAKPDGKGKGFPVVVFGGERGDLPLDKGSGRKIAEAIARTPVFAVIDLKLTSKTMWRTLVRDIFGTLQEITVDVPRHLFLEEAQEFIPQKPSHQLGAECKEIVERMVTLGGNWGYGVTIMGQRPASIEKSALSQCETVFAFATQGDHDRRALQDWMKSMQVGDAEKAALAALADLPTGECYVWSPRFMKVFARLKIRRRETFHPRDARRLGVAARDVQMANVDDFVAQVRKELTKAQAVVDVQLAPKRDKSGTKAGHAEAPIRHINAAPVMDASAFKVVQLEEQLKQCRADVDRERARANDAEGRLAAVRTWLQPQYDALQKLYGQTAAAPGSTADQAVYEPWLKRCPRDGARRMLQVLMQYGTRTRTQLGTMATVPAGGRTFRRYITWLKNNRLVEVDGDTVKLLPV